VSVADEYALVKANGGVIGIRSRTILSFTGEDRVRYLNGQLTAKLTGKNGVQPACVTTAKGKLCADVFVSTWPAAILVDADIAVSETLLPRLEKYIVADDVVVEDITQRAALLHCVGVSEESIKEITGLVSTVANRLGVPGFDLFPLSRDDVAAHWGKLTARFPIISPELAEVLRIEGGIPRWGFELDENTLPAEAGLDRTHIDFHKGCYIGQEVISRIKSVGHVNRSLRGFVSESGAPIPAGARIVTADAPETALGTITSAIFSPKLNLPIALGYLKRIAPEQGLLALAADAPDSPVPIELRGQ
jgi:tRNA-modifying protein YgfZ